MIRIHVVDRLGVQHTLEAGAGKTLMEILRDSDRGPATEVMAICGGACSCATCHVFVEQDWIRKLPAPSPVEQELLRESMQYRPEVSRLSCQITLDDLLEGFTLTVAPNE